MRSNVEKLQLLHRPVQPNTTRLLEWCALIFIVGDLVRPTRLSSFLLFSHFVHVVLPLCPRVTSGVTLSATHTGTYGPEMSHVVPLLRLVATVSQAATNGVRFGGAAPASVQPLELEMRAALARMFSAATPPLKPTGNGGGARFGGDRTAAAGGAGSEAAAVCAIREAAKWPEYNGHRGGHGGRYNDGRRQWRRGGEHPGDPYWRNGTASTTAPTTTSGGGGGAAASSATATSTTPETATDTSASRFPAPGQRFPANGGAGAGSAAAPAVQTATSGKAPTTAAGGAGGGMVAATESEHASLMPIDTADLAKYVKVTVTAQGTTDAVQLTALMDSGADVALITDSALRRLVAGGAKIVPLPSNGLRIRSATATAFDVRSAVQVAFRMPDGVEEEVRAAVVSNNLPWDAVLPYPVAVPFFFRQGRDWSAPVDTRDVEAPTAEGTVGAVALDESAEWSSATATAAPLDPFQTGPLEGAIDTAAKMAASASAGGDEYAGRPWTPLTSEEATALAAQLAAAATVNDMTAMADALKVPEQVARQLLEARVGAGLTQQETARALHLLACDWRAFVPHARGIKDEVFHMELAPGTTPQFVRAGNRLSPGAGAAARVIMADLVRAGLARWVDASA
jgi:hypothetical protein